MERNEKQMKPKFIPLLEQCIETGISLGYNRAFKYSDSPTKEEIEQEIHRAVMNEIYEWFDFPENYDGN